MIWKLWRKPAEREVRIASDKIKAIISEINTQFKIIEIKPFNEKSFNEKKLNKYTPEVKAEVLNSVAALHYDLSGLIKRFKIRLEPNLEKEFEQITKAKKFLENNIMKN